MTNLDDNLHELLGVLLLIVLFLLGTMTIIALG